MQRNSIVDNYSRAELSGMQARDAERWTITDDGRQVLEVGQVRGEVISACECFGELPDMDGVRKLTVTMHTLQDQLRPLTDKYCQGKPSRIAERALLQMKLSETQELLDEAKARHEFRMGWQAMSAD